MSKSLLALLPLLLLASCAATDTDAVAASLATEPDALTLARFEKLKALEGSWYAVDEAGNRTDTLQSKYRVSAGGSAVVETVFPGAPMEMVTLYHLDGGELVLTHYCALGNQPMMRAEHGGDADSVDFRCCGVSNVASHDDQHMHRAIFHFDAPNKLTADWTLFVDGAEGDTVPMEMVRATD